MTWKQALTRAINEEVAAEKAATQAEGERRRTWWATTWALAGVPRAEWSDAQDEYVKRTGHSASTAKHRRTVGERLSQSALGSTLPMPRFAQAASNWIGAKADEAKVKEAIKLLADAEKNEQSVREFHQALTGKPWTVGPENLTEADENAVVEKVARTRPIVIARQTVKPQVAAALPEKVVTSTFRDQAKKRVIRSKASNQAGMTPDDIKQADAEIDDLIDAVDSLSGAGQDLTTTVEGGPVAKYVGKARSAASAALTLFRKHGIRDENEHDKVLEAIKATRHLLDLLEMGANGGTFTKEDEAFLNEINVEAEDL